MKQAIVFAVVAFILSLGGTTAVMVKRAPHAAAPVADGARDSVAAGDSTAPGRTADSATHAAADTVVSRRDSAASRDSTISEDGGKGRPVPMGPGQSRSALAGSRPASRGDAPDPVARAAAVKQVARVLSSMKATEAAKVLAFLSDEEVEGILRAVGPRQAADFMTNLPKARAAALSRRLMAPRAQEQSR